MLTRVERVALQGHRGAQTAVCYRSAAGKTSLNGRLRIVASGENIRIYIHTFICDKLRTSQPSVIVGRPEL